MQNSERHAQEVRTWTTRRFVKVAPPTVHAGIGDALRHAYHMDGENRSLKNFEELLSRL
ncbi:MAG: hypothetical protein ACT4OE_01640 [Sphingosinicella sp.]